MPQPKLNLGTLLAPHGAGEPLPFYLPADHLVTHGVILGMTGSGKSGLAIDLVEEALRNQIPVLAIDVKGDIPNLLLNAPPSQPESYLPWLDPKSTERAGLTTDAAAEQLATQRVQDLAAWHLADADVAALARSTSVRVLTPGSTAGEMVHVLSALETPSPLWASDPEAAREALAASISLVLRLVGRDPDPARSRDHVVLSSFAEARLRKGRPADLASLLRDLGEPPVATLGAMSVDDYLSERERHHLATALNTLLASPTFESWRKGAPLEVRALILGLLFEQILAWVRTLPGTSELRALVLFDEVHGFLPPHPANPPAKRPLMALMKQSRAFGVGMLLATQNPMDLDYRALSNAGLWFIGRLQTDADRQRVVEGLAGATEMGGHVKAEAMASRLKALAPRWFVMRDVRATPNTWLMNSRTTLSWMRGPMTRAELKTARKLLEQRSHGATISPLVSAPVAPTAVAPEASGTPRDGGSAVTAAEVGLAAAVGTPS